MIGLFAATEAGRRDLVELGPFLGPDTVVPDGPVRPALHRLWPSLTSAVLFLGAPSAVRLIAPLLRDKRSDPGVVCVDGAFVVSLGADELAERIADVLGRTAVLGTPGEDGPLDELVELLDATVDGDLAGCSAALAAGEHVLLVNPLGFPLPALPDTVLSHGEADWKVVVDDRLPPATRADHEVRLVPRTLVVGVGSGSGVSTSAVAAALAELEAAGLDLRAVRAFATADRKAGERGILEAVEDWGFWHGDTSAPLLTFSAEVLAGVAVPNPSPSVGAAVGTASVAEAAALCGAAGFAAGGPVELAVEKVKGDNVTVAAARVLPRGRLALVGIGPGGADQRTPQADAELRRAAFVVGSAESVDRVRHLLRPGTGIHPHGAVELAASGLAVAWVAVGVGPDAPGAGARVETVRVPGVAAV
ncbi:cobalamin biosynthesis protein [Umezawaea sp.]|uniref:cobalamin biosynthesis protein n=1 Tax=Umezawaea sp. TaxID=1955258 RepID=UPI002ED033BB